VNRFTESDLENTALGWLAGAGWVTVHGPDIAPGGEHEERSGYGETILARRLHEALARLNPGLPSPALEDAFRKLGRAEGTSLESRNHAFHRMMVDGFDVEYRSAGGELRSAPVRVLDFEAPDGNEWLAVNQFTVVENRHERRPDIVLFVNGLPLAVIELKNPGDENATIRAAYRQLQTYREQIPSLFACNAVLVVSDGLEARLGALTSGWEWFKPWRTISGKTLAAPDIPQLQVLLEGVFARQRFLALLRDFIVFDADRSGEGAALVKKIAGYHQFHAVQAAVAETLRAARLRQVSEPPGVYETGLRPGGEPGDRRIGVVWHTQGSGKSLTMAFYAGRIIREPAMANPTLVVLTDRNDLDDQLFSTFSRCADLLRQEPRQAQNRVDLRAKLDVQSGGVIFTTIQKFFPETPLTEAREESPRPRNSPADRHRPLCDRHNIVVIADEAHRSQYDFIDGYARHMRDALPNASFIGFTGTPIELADANTRAVFGDHISIYDIARAVEDGATVPIHYESRLAQLALDEDQRPKIEPDFDEATEGEEVGRRERLKSKWAQLEAIVGARPRIELVARDIVEHFEGRLEAIEGKAMIVCMSRSICIERYGELARLRPGWEDGDDARGQIKIVMTGAASDPRDWQPHIGNKARREALAKRFRDPEDPLRVVLVRDMWLTGFDAPSLHTMYLDKPMQGHGLMQAIARVNRVFRDKPGGLVVDYLGLTHELKRALATYTESGGTGETALDKQQAVNVMLEKHEVCLGLFHGLDRSQWAGGTPATRLNLLAAAQEHVLAQEDGKKRCLAAVLELTQAFALAAPAAETERIRDDVEFFQTVRAALSKRADADARSDEELDHAIRQIIAKAVAPEGVVDIFAAAGLAKPDVSVLSDEFLSEVRGMKRPNLAVELLTKLLKGELATRRQRRNIVQARSFTELLERTIRRYQNRAVEAAQVIEELIKLAREIRKADARGEELGLCEDELAFYDALGVNDSAVQVLGDGTLRDIARELVETVRANVTIDWTLRENVRANLRRLVRRVLRKHGYPPDRQEDATRTVLEQAEALSTDWAV